MVGQIVKRLRKCRPQFSLRTLLVLLTLLSVWLGREVTQARRQKAVADAVYKGGGFVRYQSEESLGSYVPFQDCADRILGKDLLDTIRVVVLRRPTNHSYHGKNAGPHTALQPMNHAPPGLDGLEALWYLDVSNTDFDDRYLARLRGLRDVGVLDVRFTNVTDEGLGNIGGLSELAILRLAGRNISDVGLNQLSHVGSLKDLYLTDTAVTDAGVAAFRRAVPDCKVYLDEY